MKYSKLAGILLAACLLATSHIASAAVLSTSPQNCRLVSTSGPNYTELGSSGGFFDGKFWNKSGVTAFAICPQAWQDGLYNFYVGTSTPVACFFKATGLWGGGTTLYSGSQNSNWWSFYVGLTAGKYNGVIQCTLPPNAGMWGSMNY